MYISQMPPRSTGSRYKLGEPWDSDLADYCAAHHGAPAINVIRDAVRALIDARLANEPAVKKRFMEARQKRQGVTKNNGLRLIGPEDSGA